MRTLLVILSLAFSGPVFGGDFSKAHIDNLVSDFYAAQTAKSAIATVQSLMDPHPQQECEDREEDEGAIRESCRDIACEKLGAFGCDSLDELRAVGNACRGNRNGACLQASCDRLGTFGCDSIGEIQDVGDLCRGHYGRRCMNIACDLLGTFGCDSIGELQAVGDACRDVSSRCIESTCQRLGVFGCDSISEIQDVADSCRGT